MIVWLVIGVLFCAVLPAAMFCVNLRTYIEPPEVHGRTLPSVSVLIPARNEALVIQKAVTAVLGSSRVDLELIVMDDSSEDETAAHVLAAGARDGRVRLECAPPLPQGWNGKQHACWALAQAARHPVLCFVDADVRLEPECLSRMVNFLDEGKNGLVSGFPRQQTGTLLEWMLLPLIHFVLLGFLPICRMRAGTNPAFAAGCGQFMMVGTEDYFACGGHSGIKLTMHDGLRLPRLFREHGFRTDLADLTSLASCRMYTSASQVWSGLAKNATEGLAAPGRIVPITLVLLLGQVLPFVIALILLPARFRFFLAIYLHRMYILSSTEHGVWWLGALLVSLFAAWLPRWLAVFRFKQDWRSALLHPLGILLLLGVQWYALLRKLRGGPVGWRGRVYAGKDA